MKYHFKDLGLSNTKEMFAKANKEGYSVPAFNFNNMEQLQAIIEACVEMGSPVILQVSTGARDYIGKEMLPWLAKAATAYVEASGSDIPVALHLDHGPNFATAKDCIEYGFSSVMYDGSHHPYDENVAEAKQVAEFAHQHDVTVEAELGVLAGIEDDVVAAEHVYTQPDEVEKRIPGFPIVLHGSSGVPQQFVKMIIQYGGQLADAIGIPDEELRKASKSAVAKINVDTDGRLAFTAGIREVFANKPGEFDPRKYLGPAKNYMKNYYKEKIKDVFGSEGAYKKGAERK